jgi:hypothetical protein
MPQEQFSVAATIESLEGEERATLSLPNGQLIAWPTASLPEGAEAGSTIYLTLASEKSREAERELMAKTLLNQLLDFEESGAVS